ncbi:hypothetical protein ARMSODRAFT_792893 [Armillaria solidipes]|uniref:Uncharacterized protein n=1 Tax=Armillaria solidipes TaxID=1076256 RepID=A0A2H3C9B2_9AGAR|nr:hypothetical protein ARMSODRAFT_792893 [Armillaria solidipes]
MWLFIYATGSTSVLEYISVPPPPRFHQNSDHILRRTRKYSIVKNISSRYPQPRHSCQYLRSDSDISRSVFIGIVVITLVPHELLTSTAAFWRFTSVARAPEFPSDSVFFLPELNAIAC